MRACACLPHAPATTVSSKPAQGMNSRRLAAECLQELGRPTSMAPLFGRFSVIKSRTINLGRFGPARPSSFHPGAACFTYLTGAFLLWHTTLLFAVLQHTPESGQAGHRRGLDTRVRDACQAPKGGRRGQSGGAECWPPAVEPAKTAARWVGRWVGGGGGGAALLESLCEFLPPWPSIFGRLP